MVKKLDELREIVAEVLERDPEEIADAADFRAQYQADSMRAVEILSRIEKKYKVEIPQHELAEMANLTAVYNIVARYAGWE
jgi:acyl carrier protein